jgi:ribose transport system substrate-binding protein
MASADARPKLIGLFVIHERTGYQRLLAEEGRRVAKKMGVGLEVFSADDTAALQSAQIVRFLNTHPDEHLAVIAMAVSDIGHERPLANLARKVLSRGAGWVMLNRDLEAHVAEMRREFPSMPVSLVGIDNREIGRIQGRQVKAALGGRPSCVLYVVGSALTSAARDRRAGLLDVVTSPTEVVEVEGMWSMESGEKAVARWLASPAAQESALDLVACQNDPMAVGARQAVERAARDRNRPDWGRVPLMGVDGLPEEGQRLVDEGALAATVIVPPTSGPAVEMVARFWQSGAPLPARFVLDCKPYRS